MTARALALGVVLAAALVPAGAQQPTFKAGVEIVAVDVLVTSGDRLVPGLTSADFDVRDNGVRQRVDRVTEGGLQAVPLDVVLVFDTSGSMAGPRLQQLVEAGRGVLDRLRPVDRAALVTFSDRTVLQQSPTSDCDSVRRALDGMSAVDRTSMFDGLYVALMRPRSPDSRSMVLLFSDGLDNASWLSGKQVLQVALESDSVVYAVGLDESIRRQVGDLAAQTGGDVVIADSTKRLRTLFARLLAEMQARYVLTYYPQNVTREGWHAIDVRVPGRSVRVKARRGYSVATR